MVRLCNVFVRSLSGRSRLPLLCAVMLACPLRLGHAAEKAEADAAPAQETAPAATVANPGVVGIRPSALEALGKVGKLSPRRSVSQLLRTGFRADKQKGEVLIETSAPVELQPAPVAGGKVSLSDSAVFLIKGCRITRRNDRLPLDTRFFHSSVTGVFLRQRGADVEVVVALRAPVTALPRREVGPAGSSVWVLEFPAVEETRTASAAP